MKLVDDAKQAYRWISMQCMILAGAVQAGWMYLPEDLKASLSPETVKTTTLVLLVLGIAGRLVKQEPK
jgi:hypothetical protein